LSICPDRERGAVEFGQAESGEVLVVAFGPLGEDGGCRRLAELEALDAVAPKV